MAETKDDRDADLAKTGGRDLRPCVFFDRDGVVNASPGDGYVESVADFHLLSAFVNILRLITVRGYQAVIISNQQGVGKEIMTQKALDEIHDRLQSILFQKKLKLLDIYACPHLEGTCRCRKPQPGMILNAAEKHGLDLSSSWMIGDKERDVEAGRRADCKTVLVNPSAETTQANFRVSTLDELKALLHHELSDSNT